MEKPAGSSGGDDGDPPKKAENSSKPKPTSKPSPEKEPEKPESAKKTPLKLESSSQTKIKREESEDGGGGRVKTDSSSSSVEDVQRALTEYMTMAQVSSQAV